MPRGSTPDHLLSWTLYLGLWLQPGLVGQVSDPGDNSLSSLGGPCGNSTHTQESLLHHTYRAALLGDQLMVSLGPGQSQLHSTETKVCSLDSPQGRAECYLGVCCLFYLLNLSSGLHLTCFDLLRLGLHSGGRTHSFSGP